MDSGVLRIRCVGADAITAGAVASHLGGHKEPSSRFIGLLLRNVNGLITWAQTHASYSLVESGGLPVLESRQAGTNARVARVLGEGQMIPSS